MKSENALNLLLKSKTECVEASRVYRMVEIAEQEAEKRGYDYARKEDRRRVIRAFCLTSSCVWKQPNHKCSQHDGVIDIGNSCPGLSNFLIRYDNEA